MKRKIVSFSDYDSQMNSSGFEEHSTLVNESLSIRNLYEICDFFKEYSKTSSAHNSSDILMKTIHDLLYNSTQLFKVNDVHVLSSIKSGKAESFIINERKLLMN